MAKSPYIVLGDRTRVPILYEDTAVMAIDKPAGWMLAPANWDRTARNLQRALESGLREGDFWARSRNLRFLRFIHRLDADTSGVLLLAKHAPALTVFSRMFAQRQVSKCYLAVVTGTPRQTQWTCDLPLGRDPARPRQSKVLRAPGREAVTAFELLEAGSGKSLVLARPLTGRTHQIRIHLAALGHPILGDPLYGPPQSDRAQVALALRATQLSYQDPFRKKQVRIEAPSADFLARYGFAASQ